MKYEVIVVGGGASGMMAAITAAKRGKKVAILEHMDRLGKKILMTGNGKCNYSNTNQNISCYRCREDAFVKNVLNQFSQKEAELFFKENGIITKNKNGYLYPNSGQAAVINDVLRFRCENLGIEILYQCECVAVKKEKNDSFLLECIEKERNHLKKVKADSVIISTGGKAYPKTGSDGSGYVILKKLGHSIIKPLPALTALYCHEKFFKALKGIRCDGEVILNIDGKIAAKDRGEIQLTDYGISGIPVFQVSRYASIALEKKRQVTAALDFLPDMNSEQIIEMLQAENGFTIEQKLNGMINKKLSAVILKNAGIRLQSKKGNIQRILEMLKSMTVHITATGGFEQSQVCTGGVDIREIDSDTMESKLVKNLFITGEVIDVDGICGGYNLQWAWSTGYIAGNNC